MSGSDKGPTRKTLIDAFEDDPEFAVLIVTSVGVAGLNLQCAHILVIFVSGLESRELCSLTRLLGRPVERTRGRAAPRQGAPPGPKQAGPGLPAGRMGHPGRVPEQHIIFEGENDGLVHGGHSGDSE